VKSNKSGFRIKGATGQRVGEWTIEVTPKDTSHPMEQRCWSKPIIQKTRRSPFYVNASITNPPGAPAALRPNAPNAPAGKGFHSSGNSEGVAVCGRGTLTGEIARSSRRAAPCRARFLAGDRRRNLFPRQISCNRRFPTVGIWSTVDQARAWGDGAIWVDAARMRKFAQ